MERFKKHIAITRNISACLMVLFLAAAIAPFLLFPDTENMFFLAGVFSALGLCCLFIVCSYTKALKDTEKLRKLYIEQHDERKIAISSKSYTFSFGLIMLGITIASIITRFTDPAVSDALLMVIYMSLITIAGSRAYFKRRN